jgi:hypothetical protein
MVGLQSILHLRPHQLRSEVRWKTQGLLNVYSIKQQMRGTTRHTLSIIEDSSEGEGLETDPP